jgi:oxygen-independent coproporphyrinogen-3 oxidase
VPEREPLGLYLHIPFCESICNYCNFNRGLLDSELKTRYVDALTTEIIAIGDGAAVDTIYFGGGTPSLLDPGEVGRILDVCRDSFDVDPSVEVSLEVNPESATMSRLTGWRESGVTRLSFGVQSFRDTELQRLGRRHTAIRAKDAVRAARTAGYADISLDLMLWLPGQTAAHGRESIETLLELAPEHASLYLLELYPNAPLREEMARAGWSLAPDEDAALMYLDALEATDRDGYEQYEISNVSRPGRQCRHNLKYWRDGEWLGFGCGAHSTRDGARWRNLSETIRYIETVTAGRPAAVDRRSLSPLEWLGDVLFMGLRLTEGLDLESIQRQHGVAVMRKYGTELAPFIAEGLLIHEFGRLQLTRQGMLVANEIMGTFV